MAKLKRTVYRIVRWLVWLVYPRIEVVGQENLPGRDAIIVGNHSQMNGPIISQLYFPGERTIWCAGQMMELKEVPDYAYADFWSGKPKWQRPFYRLLSYLVAPLSVCVFTNANTIGVYRDSRIVSTFKQTVKKLQSGSNIIIFPECYEPYNQIICNFQRNFVDIAKLYYKRTGIALDFVPLYIAPRLKKIFIGKPIRYCPDAPFDEEQQRIVSYLMEEITRIAVSQPEHIVVPYPNISKKYYRTNLSNEVITCEKTGG